MTGLVGDDGHNSGENGGKDQRPDKDLSNVHPLYLVENHLKHSVKMSKRMFELTELITDFGAGATSERRVGGCLF